MLIYIFLGLQVIVEQNIKILVITYSFAYLLLLLIKKIAFFRKSLVRFTVSLKIFVTKVDIK